MLDATNEVPNFLVDKDRVCWLVDNFVERILDELF
jgi:hypothetical protein